MKIKGEFTIEKILDQLVTFVTGYGLKLVGSLVLLVVCWKLIGTLAKFIGKNKHFDKIDAGAKGFLITFVSVVLKVVLVLTVAANLGVPMTNVVAIVGSCGLAVGLALQGSLANFAGGIMLLIFRPFRVGNYIESSGKEGTVKEVSLLSTTLTTADNKDIVIPNGNLMNSIITNYSAEKTRRVDLEVNVSYSADTERVKKVLLVLAEKHELVLSDPAPVARMTKHGDSSLVFALRAWCLSENYWTVRFDLLEQIKEAFDKLEITIPYPQMEVRIKE
jgi:small conductance mechanosensitive channel